MIREDKVVSRKTGLVFGVWAFLLLVLVFGVVLNVQLARGSGTPNQDQLGSDGFQVAYSINLPLIDGSVADSEWNDANSYEIMLNSIQARVYFKHDDTDIYLGLKVFCSWHLDPIVQFERFGVYFDEGDDGGYGSGTRDGILTENQEDLKTWAYTKIGGGGIRKEDGCYMQGDGGLNWYLPSGGDFDAKCSFVLDHWECEFSIPFVGNDGGEGDVSDLTCTVSDTIGIKLGYYVKPGPGEKYYYPAGNSCDIQTYTTLSFEPGGAPAINILSPENTTYTSSSVPLTFKINESTSWIGYSLDSQMNVTIDGNTTLVNLSDGTHTITIYANDTAGNMGSADMVPFTVDTTPPSITIVSPENKTYPTTNIPLTFTVDEPVSWMAYSLDKQVNMTITGNTTPSGLSNGSHSLVVYAEDTAGNTGASEIIYFSIETPQPFPIEIAAVIGIVAVVGVVAFAYFTKFKK